MATGSASFQFSQLARDLYRMPPATRRRLRRSFQQAGQAALSDAKSRASWSHRIPAAISGKSELSVDRIGYTLRASVANAPHARPYEGMGQGGKFRHPVFGHRDRWVTVATRPYLWPAVRGRVNDITTAANDAFEAAARECGFH
jgi:hypothetical protein